MPAMLTCDAKQRTRTWGDLAFRGSPIEGRPRPLRSRGGCLYRLICDSSVYELTLACSPAVQVHRFAPPGPRPEIRATPCISVLQKLYHSNQSFVSAQLYECKKFAWLVQVLSSFR